MYIRFPVELDAEELAAMALRNREFFQEFSPISPEEYYTVDHHLEAIRRNQQERESDKKYSFVVCLGDNGTVIGTVGLSFVVRGPLQSCMIGYSLDRAYNGKGYMTEAVKQVVRYAFEELKFHRIVGEASPRNTGSIRVLEKAGFHKEGIARSNVKINGIWEDHQVLAILNPADED